MTAVGYAEQRMRKPLVPHRPQVGDAVTGVECICRVDEEEFPLLPLIFLGKEGADRVHRALYPSLETSAPATFRTHLVSNRCRFLLIPISLMPGHLSSAIS